MILINELRDEGGQIPDWYIISINTKDTNEGVKLFCLPSGC